MKRFILYLCIFIQPIALGAEKPDYKTYVLNGVVFNEQNDLKKNLAALSKLNDKRKLKTTTCCEQVFTFKEFSKHVSHGHKKDEIIACPSCEYTSNAVTSVQHHYFYDHVKSKIFKCPKCLETFREQGILKRHFKKCISGTLARGSRGSNDDMKRSLNEKIANLNPEQKSNFKTNFNNFHELNAYIQNTKQGNYFSCIFKGCTTTDNDIKKIINCSIKHIDADFFTCYKCFEKQSSYEELNAHIKKCFNYKKQIPTNNEPEEPLIIELHGPFQPVETVAYSQQPALPACGVEQHPTDSIMQRLTQNNNNTNTVSDRDKLRQALLQRL